MDPNLPGAFDLDGLPCSAQHNNALAALRLLRNYNHFIVPPDVSSVVGPILGSLSVLPPQPPAASCLPSYCQHRPLPSLLQVPCDPDSRRRGEKRPIPAELKDDKYFERRRRNNQAAKKSRDARRMREDQIAWRACLLEQENATLRAHVAALRQEALTLRGMLATRDEQRLPAPTSTTND